MNLYDPPAQFFDLFFPVRYARALDSNTSWKEDVSSNSISSGGLSLRSFAASFVIKGGSAPLCIPESCSNALDKRNFSWIRNFVHQPDVFANSDHIDVAPISTS